MNMPFRKIFKVSWQTIVLIKILAHIRMDVLNTGIRLSCYIRDVFRVLSNSYDGAFLHKY